MKKTSHINFIYEIDLFALRDSFKIKNGIL